MRSPRSQFWRIAQVVVAVILIAGLGAGAAAAQDREPPEYRRTIERAVSEFAMRNFEEARALFARAHGIVPSARTLRGLGMAEFELRNYGAATEHLTEALSSKVRPLEGALRADTETLLERANDYVARYRINAQPDPSEVSVDGIAVRLPADKTLILQVGDHLLELRAVGYQSERLRLSVNGGEVDTLSVTFKKALAEPTEDAPRARRPLRKNPWLWTAVGVVVAGAATATGLALVRGGERGDPFTGNTGVGLKGP